MRTNVRDQAQPLREMVENNKKTPKSMKVIAIASGKGGVGKSSICVNMALALKSLGYNVLVVDADFGLANIDVMLGVSAKYNIGHLIRGEKSVQEIIQEGLNGVRFISGGSGVFELLQMDERQLWIVLRGLMRLKDPVDVILFDAGAGINDKILQLIESSNDTIIVTTPEPTAILDAYALVKTIVKEGTQKNIRLIMNKCESRKEAEQSINGFTQVMQRHLYIQVEPLGYVLYDHEVVKSIKSQLPVMLSQPNGATAKEITNIARTLMELPRDDGGPAKKIARFFERLLG